MLFYYPSGRQAHDLESFTSAYNEVYYYLNRDREFEKRIDSLVSADSLSKDDLIDILQWKTGANETDYEAGTVKTTWHTIDVNAVSKMIAGRKPAFLIEDHSEDEQVVKLLKELTSFEGIGPVYAITLAFFLTKGRLPIYDRFAHLSLIALDCNMDFVATVPEKQLLSEFNTSWSMEKLYERYKENYVERINRLFGRVYYQNRRLDRALWAYGHLFSSNKQNERRS